MISFRFCRQRSDCVDNPGRHDLALQNMFEDVGDLMWEYCSIDLTDLRRRQTDIDVLNDAGEDGWELVGIVAPYRAILKRPGPAKLFRPDASGTKVSAAGDDRRTCPAAVKYRDPATGQTWTGRGRMASWLASKIAAGELADRYLVAPHPGAHD